MFYRLRPWYLRFAKVDSCLCSCCENYAGYMEGIRIIAAYLRDVLKVTSELERKLVTLGECKHKKEHMGILLCPSSQRTAQCINGSCKHCGFKKLWSEGLAVTTPTNSLSASSSTRAKAARSSRMPLSAASSRPSLAACSATTAMSFSPSSGSFVTSRMPSAGRFTNRATRTRLAV